MHLDFRDAADNKIVGPGLEGGGRDGITEDVMRPGQRRGRRYHHIARNQSKIAALTWTKHQSMRPEAHGQTVSIGCPVIDLEPDHKSSIMVGV
jgi:hypothetical protein